MHPLSNGSDKKKCCRCEEIKPLEDFFIRNSKRNIRHSRCKACASKAPDFNGNERKKALRQSLTINCWKITPELKSRFFSKTASGSDSCLTWQAKKNQKGYGLFSVRGIEFSAHRVAYRLAYGPIPDGLCVLHRCDNPSCVNSAHLFLGTNSENIADRMAKNRSNRKPRRVLTTLAQVKEVRRRYGKGEKIPDIASAMGLPPRRVRAIAHKETWRSA